MSAAHASHRRGRRTSGRVRALVALGMLLGVTQLGTMASWSDSATVNSGAITSGTLDLTVGEAAANQLTGQGGTWTHSSLAIAGMAPGESIAKLLTVGNGGSIPLTYNGTVATSNNALFNATTPGLQVTIYKGSSTATNANATAPNRSGTCDGTVTSVNGTNVSTTPIAINAANITLAASASTTYCVVAKLAAGSPNAMQGQSTTLQFVFNASQ